MTTVLPVSDIPFFSAPKLLPWLHSVERDAQRVHAQLGLPLPSVHAPTAPLALAAEQMGVELRPATIYKLMILEQLGRRGMRAVFMFEERDVASKDKRLRGWAMPSLANKPGSSDGVQRISPLGPTVTAKTLHNRPLAHVPITLDYAKAAATIVSLYRPLVERNKWWALNKLVNEFMEFLAAQAGGATTLAQLGQRQLAHVAARLGIQHVTFCNLSAVEDPLLATGLEGLQSVLPLQQAVEAGLMPADAAPFWGRHSGACCGRVKVLPDLQASCLRCGETLAQDAWTPLSLRASIRMLALQKLGVDLFIAGGSSGYNAGIRDFQHRHGRPYVPLAWHAGLSYAGPAQLASPQIAAETAAGGLSLIDAFIGTSFADPRGVFHAADLPDPLQGAFDHLGACMRDTLARNGVRYQAGEAPPPLRPAATTAQTTHVEVCA